MKKVFYFVRHGHATHLEYERATKLNSKDVWMLFKKWENAKLTQNGIEALKLVKNKLPNNLKSFFSSPLLRTQETMRILSDSKPILLDSLIEIQEKPINLPLFLKLSVNSWIVFCTMQNILRLGFIKYAKQASQIFKELGGHDSPALIVSHEARIWSFILYSFFSHQFKIKSLDLMPGGITVIERRD